MSIRMHPCYGDHVILQRDKENDQPVVYTSRLLNRA